jgi:hypothetical protein
MRSAGMFARPAVRAALTALLVVLLASCGKSAPVYSAISTMGRNYLPYNMNGFTITDAYGNKASGGGDDPPGGGGGVACCYKLKGTEFTVKWDYYDVDQWTPENSHMQHAETKVSMPATPVPDTVGTRIFEVHFFPDRHVEFQFPGGLLDPSRIPVVEVSRWISSHYQSRLDKKYDDNWAERHRRIARAVATAWLKYRLTNEADLEQYAYFNLLINDRFDAHPEVQRILQESKDKPGHFAQAIQSLPRNILAELRNNQFTAVAVPEIADGLLPPPRTEEKKNA